MARASRRGRQARRPPPSPTRIAALIATAVLIFLLGIRLHAYLETPAGRRVLGAAAARERRGDTVAGDLFAALEQLGVERSAVERRVTRRVVTGKAGAETWTIAVPRRVSLVECNLAMTRAARRLGLAVRDVWEHRSEDGDWPALTMSIAGAGAVGDGGSWWTAVRARLDGVGRSEPARPDADMAGAGSRRERPGREHERFRLTFVKFPPADRGRIAIVIDDFGFGWDEASRAFLEFPAPLTLAVLPGYRSSRRVADAARGRGYEVILHLPLEPEGFPRVKPGPEVILVHHRPAEVRARMRRALKSVGPVSGISSHMGSLATTDADVMRVVLEETRRQGLFFLDSRTTPQSVVERVARRIGTPCVGNRLFLDDERSREMIAARLEEAIGIAIRAHEVVVIGHPYPETLEVLTEALPRIEQRDVRLVPLSALVPAPLVF